MVTIEEAIEKIYNLSCTIVTEIVSLEQGLGRVCAKDYFAKFDMPRFDNSAMDGYAVKLADAGSEVQVSHELYAGQSVEFVLENAQAIKIMTGAKLPKGCEAVVPIEDVSIKGAYIKLPAKIKHKANMRFSGEDLQSQSIVVTKNTSINPYDIGALASQGYSYIEVFQKLQVSVLSSGSELKAHYESVTGAQLYNSNTPTIESFAKALNCQVHSLKAVDDSLEGMVASIQNCLHCDLIITTGGASVGEKDFTKEAIQTLGAQTVFEKIEIKPGKPTSLYKIKESYLLVLPGNPLAAMVNFELFGKALIWQLQKKLYKYHQPFMAKNKTPYQKKGDRDTIILGVYDGEFFVPLSLQLPGMVKPLTQANAFIVLAKNKESLQANEALKVMLLHSNFNTIEKKDIFTR